MKRGPPFLGNSEYRSKTKKDRNMAKESMKAREVKRQKLVEKYAEKRAKLKKIIINLLNIINLQLFNVFIYHNIT